VVVACGEADVGIVVQTALDGATTQKTIAENVQGSGMVLEMPQVVKVVHSLAVVAVDRKTDAGTAVMTALDGATLQKTIAKHAQESGTEVEPPRVAQVGFYSTKKSTT